MYEISIFIFKMSHKALASFSTSGHYYAHISGDGKLRIWDVTTCILKQEFTPDFHLTSPYTELCWISSSKSVNIVILSVILKIRRVIKVVKFFVLFFIVD